MQLTKTLIAAVFAAITALAAPAPSDKSMMSAAPQWTIESLKRVCDSADHVCTWTFGTNTHLAPTTPCTHVVKSNYKASEANGGPSQCGGYTITSGWSGQFGPGNGFTTLSVVDNAKRLIVFPAYTDNQVKDGNVVTPNQSYAPAGLP